MFLLKLNSDLQNLVKKFQSAMKINKIQTEFPRSGMHRGEGGDCMGLFILPLRLMFYRCNRKIVFLE